METLGFSKYERFRKSSENRIQLNGASSQVSGLLLENIFDNPPITYRTSQIGPNPNQRSDLFVCLHALGYFVLQRFFECWEIIREILDGLLETSSFGGGG